MGVARDASQDGIKRSLRLKRDLGVSPAGGVLVLQLMDELDALRSHL